MTGTEQSLFKETQVKIGLFRRKVEVRPGTVLVLYRQGKPPIVLKPNDTLTAGERRWGKFQAAYEVNMREFPFKLTMNSPARDGAFHFQVTIEGTYRVANPVEVVEKQVTSPVSDYIQPLLQDYVRQVTQRHDIDQSLATETELRQGLGNIKWSIPFHVQVSFVGVSLDEKTKRHVEQLREEQREGAREIQHIQQSMELEKLKQQMELERERFRLQMQQMRLDFYKPIIESGNWGMLAAQLAQHPEDVASVAQIMRDMWERELAFRLKMLEVAVDKDVLETYQLDESMRSVLRDLVSILRAGLPPSAELPGPTNVEAKPLPGHQAEGTASEGEETKEEQEDTQET